MQFTPSKLLILKRLQAFPWNLLILTVNYDIFWSRMQNIYWLFCSSEKSSEEVKLKDADSAQKEDSDDSKQAARNESVRNNRNEVEIVEISINICLHNKIFYLLNIKVSLILKSFSTNIIFFKTSTIISLQLLAFWLCIS